MAVIFDIRNSEGKRLLVIKHVEIRYFRALGSTRITEIRNKCIILVYFGYYTVLPKDIEFADGYICTNNVIKSLNRSWLPRINYNGFNFISSCRASFDNFKESKKMFSHIYVGDTSRRKGLSTTIDSIDRAMKKNSDLSFLIICRLNSSRLIDIVRGRAVKKKLARLSNFHGPKFTLIFPDRAKGSMLPKNMIMSLMEHCDWLFIPSSEEGAARVVAEAKLTGLRVLSNGKMLGGTNNFLEDDDYLYKNLDDLEDQLCRYSSQISAVKDSDKIRRAQLLYSEEINVPNWSGEVSRLFDFNSQELTDECYRLGMSDLLSSHRKTLPRSIPSVTSDDHCTTVASMFRLYDYLIYSRLGKVYRIEILRTLFLKIDELVSAVRRFFGT